MSKTQSMRDFSGGVVNQELQNRDDGRGVFLDARNVLSSWNGGLRRRTGTYWLKTLSGPNRMIPFRKPDGNDMLLLLSDGHIEAVQFVDDEHIEPVWVPSGTVPTFPDTGWTGETTNGDYTIAISSDAAQTEWGKGFNKYVGDGHYYDEGSNYTGGYNVTTNVPATVDISSTNPQIFVSAVIRWCNTCKGNHKGHYKGWVDPVIQYSDDGTNWTSVNTTHKNPYAFGGSDAYRASYLYGSGSNQKTENYIVYEVTNVSCMEPHAYWRINMQLRVTNNQTYSNERIDLFVQNVKYAAATMAPFSTTSTFFTEDNIYDIKFAQHNNTMYLTNGTDPALQIDYNAGGFTIAAQVNSLDYGTNGYPKCVAVYSNRLWYGGFTAFPTKVWGSAFGDYADFTIPGTIKATSPIEATCIEIKSIIDNLWGASTALYALSADGVSMIDAGGGIVATDQIEFKLRNHEPVDPMTPTVKSDVMIYLGRDKQKVFMTDYDLVVQRFRVTNIAKKYSHFLSAGVKEMHVVPDKADLIYGTLENGQMFAILFDLEQQINSVWPIYTNGFVSDIQPIKFEDKTRLCMLVQRSGVWQLEYKKDMSEQELMDFMSEEEKKDYTAKVFAEDIYLDCVSERTYDTPIKIINDLPYGDNQEVEVFADGVYLGKKRLSVSSDSGLYAWKYNGEYVYTTTPNPTTASVVYDANGEPMDGYLISAVGANDIMVYHYQPQLVSYYAYDRVTALNVNITTNNPNASNSAPIGTYIFNRNPSQDGSSSYITGCCWQSGNYQVSTPNEYGTLFSASPVCYVNMGNMRKGQGTIATKIKTYCVNQIPNIGDTIYNDDDTVLGTVSDKEAIEYGQQTFYSITVNGTKYYQTTADNVIEQEEVAVYQVFARDSTADLAYDGVALILDEEASRVLVGLPYQAYAVIKFVTPYMIRKYPREVAVNFINTAYLELGNTFEDLRPVLDNLADTITLDNRPILLNGNYEKTLDKQAFETPYVIVNSDKGLPFNITGIDYEVDYSNYQGGV